MQKLRSHPGSALGVAYAAGIAIGALERWSDIEGFVEPGDTVEPHDHCAYDESYATYRALYPALRGVASGGRAIRR